MPFDTYSDDPPRKRQSLRPIPAPTPDDVADIAEKQYGIDGDFAAAVFDAESGYNPNAKSKAGARGISQLMPGTVKRVGVTDIKDPWQQVHGGLRELSRIWNDTNGDAVETAKRYNGGDAYPKNPDGQPAFRETRQYPIRVANSLSKRQSLRPMGSSTPEPTATGEVPPMTGRADLSFAQDNQNGPRPISEYDAWQRQQSPAREMAATAPQEAQAASTPPDAAQTPGLRSSPQGVASVNRLLLNNTLLDVERRALPQDRAAARALREKINQEYDASSEAHDPATIQQKLPEWQKSVESTIRQANRNLRQQRLQQKQQATPPVRPAQTGQPSPVAPYSVGPALNQPQPYSGPWDSESSMRSPYDFRRASPMQDVGDAINKLPKSDPEVDHVVRLRRAADPATLRTLKNMAQVDPYVAAVLPQKIKEAEYAQQALQQIDEAPKRKARELELAQIEYDHLPRWQQIATQFAVGLSTAPAKVARAVQPLEHRLRASLGRGDTDDVTSALLDSWDYNARVLPQVDRSGAARFWREGAAFVSKAALAVVGGGLAPGGILGQALFGAAFNTALHDSRNDSVLDSQPGWFRDALGGAAMFGGAAAAGKLSGAVGQAVANEIAPVTSQVAADAFGTSASGIAAFSTNAMLSYAVTRAEGGSPEDASKSALMGGLLGMLQMRRPNVRDPRATAGLLGGAPDVMPPDAGGQRLLPGEVAPDIAAPADPVVETQSRLDQVRERLKYVAGRLDALRKMAADRASSVMRGHVPTGADPTAEAASLEAEAATLTQEEAALNHQAGKAIWQRVKEWVSPAATEDAGGLDQVADQMFGSNHEVRSKVETVTKEADDLIAAADAESNPQRAAQNRDLALQRLKYARDAIKSSPEYESELIAGARGAAPKTSLRDRVLEIEQKISSLQPQDETLTPEQKKAQQKQQREADALAKQKETEQKAAEERQAAEDKRIQLHDQAKVNAAVAEERARQALDAGDYETAEVEFNLAQKSLGTQGKYLPETPEGLRLREELGRRAGQLGNEIGKVRKLRQERDRAQKKPQAVATAPAAPSGSLLESKVNEEGGVPKLAPAEVPVNFERLADQTDTPEDELPTLLRWVRRQGGVQYDEATGGELRRLMPREGGTTGLVARNGRYSVDELRQMAVSEGLSRAETETEFIDELENELRYQNRREAKAAQQRAEADEWAGATFDNTMPVATKGPKPVETAKSTAQPKPEPAAPAARTVEVNGTQVTLTPEQEARWVEEVEKPLETAREALDHAMQVADGVEAAGDGNAASIMRGKASRDYKAKAMRLAAVKREITGQLTDIEQAKTAEREAGNYKGKPVSVEIDGERVNATVDSNQFGRVRVQLADGETRVVERDTIGEPVAEAPDDTVSRMDRGDSDRAADQPRTDDRSGVDDRPAEKPSAEPLKAEPVDKQLEYEQRKAEEASSRLQEIGEEYEERLAIQTDSAISELQKHPDRATFVELTIEAARGNNDSFNRLVEMMKGVGNGGYGEDIARELVRITQGNARFAVEYAGRKPARGGSVSREAPSGQRDAGAETNPYQKGLTPEQARYLGLPVTDLDDREYDRVLQALDELNADVIRGRVALDAATSERLGRQIGRLKAERRDRVKAKRLPPLSEVHGDKPSYIPKDQQAAEIERRKAEAAAEITEIRPPDPSQKPHDYASTQFNLEGKDRDDVLRLGKRVDVDDLADDGWEEQPHLTVLWGLHTPDPANVQQTIRGFGPITVTLGRTSFFPANEENDYDVVKIDVEGRDLRRLRKLLESNQTNTQTFKDYQPHITLAYVQPGKGREYSGLTDLEGRKITFNALTFSAQNRAQYAIALERTRRDAVDSGNAAAGAPAGDAGADSVAAGGTDRLAPSEGAGQADNQSVPASRLNVGDTIEHRDPHLNGSEVVGEDPTTGEAVVRTKEGRFVVIQHPDGPEGNSAIKLPEVDESAQTAKNTRPAQPPEISGDSAPLDESATRAPNSRPLSEPQPAPTADSTATAVEPKTDQSPVSREPWQMTRAEYVQSGTMRERGPALTYDAWASQNGYPTPLEEHGALRYPHGISKAERRRIDKRLTDTIARLAEGQSKYNSLVESGEIPMIDIERQPNPDSEAHQARMRAQHRRAVRRAIDAGEAVPATVLNDYPDLLRLQQEYHLRDAGEPAADEGASYSIGHAVGRPLVTGSDKWTVAHQGAGWKVLDADGRVIADNFRDEHDAARWLEAKRRWEKSDWNVEPLNPGTTTPTEAAERVRARFRRPRRHEGALWINGHAMHAIVSSMQRVKRNPIGQAFAGAMISRPLAMAVVEDLNRRAEFYKGEAGRRLTALAEEMRKALWSTNRGGIALVRVDAPSNTRTGLLRHERGIHTAQETLRGGDTYDADPGWLTNSTAYPKVAKALAAQGYDESTFPREVPAWIAEGQARQLGLEQYEAEDLLLSYFDAVYQRHGDRALDLFADAGRLARETIEFLRSEYDADRRRDSAGPGGRPGSAQENRATDARRRQPAAESPGGGDEVLWDSEDFREVRRSEGGAEGTAQSQQVLDLIPRNVKIIGNRWNLKWVVEEMFKGEKSQAEVLSLLPALAGAPDNSLVRFSTDAFRLPIQEKDLADPDVEPRHKAAYQRQIEQGYKTPVFYTPYFELNVRGPEIKEQVRSVYLDLRGRIQLHNEFLTKKRNAAPGYGLRMLARQIAAAQSIGIRRISTTAAGDASSLKPKRGETQYSGYYVWPRIGYDFSLTPEHKAMLPEQLDSAETVQDLMGTEAGRKWWKEHGGMEQMDFDLTPGSKSLKAFHRYLREHGYELPDEGDRQIALATAAAPSGKVDEWGVPALPADRKGVTRRDYVEGARFDYERRPGTRQPAIYCNQRTAILIGSVLKRIGRPTEAFAGMQFPDSVAQQIADELNKVAAENLTEKWVDVLDDLAETFRRAAREAEDGAGITVIRTDTSLPWRVLYLHEIGVHRAQRVLGRGNVLEMGADWLTSRPEYDRISKALTKIAPRNYGAPEAQAVEVPAWIAQGSWEVLGLTDEEGLDVLDAYFRAVVDYYGTLGLMAFSEAGPRAEYVIGRIRDEYWDRRLSGGFAGSSQAAAGTGRPAVVAGRGGESVAAGSGGPEEASLAAISPKEKEGSPERGALNLFGPKPNPATRLRNLPELDAHRPLKIDPADIDKRTREALRTAYTNKLLPGARVVAVANLIKAKPLARVFSRRQTKYLQGVAQSLNNLWLAHGTMVAEENAGRRGSKAYLDAKAAVNTARLEIGRDLDRVTPYSKPLEYIGKLSRAGMLSGLAVPLYNILDQVINLPLHEASKAVPVGLLQKLMQRYAGLDPVVTGVHPLNLLEGLARGLAGSAAEGYRSIRYGRTQRELLEDLTEGPRAGDKFEFAGKARLIWGLDQVINGVFRVQQVADIPGRSIIFEQALLDQAWRIAREVGKAKNLTKKQIAKIAHDLHWEPSEQMVRLAEAESSRFVHDVETPLYHLIKRTRATSDSLPSRAWNAMHDQIIPFSKVPAAAGRAAFVDYTPIGLLWRTADLLTAIYNYQTSAGGAGGGGKVPPMDAVAYQDAVQRWRQGVVGSIILLLLGIVAAMLADHYLHGYDRDTEQDEEAAEAPANESDEDEGEYSGITEGRDSRSRIANLQEALGEPYDPSLVFGGKSWPMSKFGIIGMQGQLLVSVGQAMRPRTDKYGAPEAASDRRGRVAGAAAKSTIGELPLLREIYSGGDGKSPVERAVTSRVRSLVPGAVREYARQAVPDQRMPDNTDIGSKLRYELQSGLPEGRRELRRKLNAMGDPIPEADLLRRREISRDPGLSRMRELEVGVTKPMRRQGESAAAYQMRLEEQGRRNRESMFEVNSSLTRSMPDEAQRDYLNREFTPKIQQRNEKLSGRAADIDRDVAVEAQAGERQLKKEDWFADLDQKSQGEALKAYRHAMAKFYSKPRSEKAGRPEMAGRPPTQAEIDLAKDKARKVGQEAGDGRGKLQPMR